MSLVSLLLVRFGQDFRLPSTVGLANRHVGSPKLFLSKEFSIELNVTPSARLSILEFHQSSRPHGSLSFQLSMSDGRVRELK